MLITWLQRWCNMISSVTRCKPRVCLFSLQISSQTNFNKARWQICKIELNSEQCCRFIRTHPACARTDTRTRRDRKWIREQHWFCLLKRSSFFPQMTAAAALRYDWRDKPTLTRRLAAPASLDLFVSISGRAIARRYTITVIYGAAENELRP